MANNLLPVAAVTATASSSVPVRGVRARWGDLTQTPWDDQGMRGIHFVAIGLSIPASFVASYYLAAQTARRRVRLSGL